MNRRKFLGIAGATVVIAGATYYTISDNRNFVREDSFHSNVSCKGRCVLLSKI